jgi:hypothetical protein
MFEKRELIVVELKMILSYPKAFAAWDKLMKDTT